MMWIERFSALANCCNFYPPAKPEQIATIEEEFDVILPDELRGILLETNGLSVSPPSLCETIGEEDTCFNLISSVEEIIEENRQMRETYLSLLPDEQLPPIDSMLFVASDFNGYYFACRITERKISDTTLIGVSHEGWNNYWVEAASLWERLQRVLTVIDKV